MSKVIHKNLSSYYLNVLEFLLKDTQNKIIQLIAFSSYMLLVPYYKKCSNSLDIILSFSNSDIC